MTGLFVACSQTPAAATGAPPPAPVKSGNTTAGSWLVRDWSGSSRYQFSRRATVQSDSANERPVPVSAAGFELLTRSSSPSTTIVSLAVDGAEASGTRAAKPSQSVSAVVSSGRLDFVPDDRSPAVCDIGRTELRADLSDLAFPTTGRITLGTGWSDSVFISICIAGVPGSAGIARRFEPVGDTTLAGETAIVVQRTDKTLANAAGFLDQHSISLAADGNSTARLYVSASGRILRVTKLSVLRIAAKTAGRTRSFVQNTTSAFQLVR